MNLIFRMLWYLPSLLISSIRFVHSKDSDLTELEDNIAWAVGVGVTILVFLVLFTSV